MNNCMFVGHLGNDAELSQAGNSQVCKFSVANSTGYGDKKSTMWISCTLWGKRGQSLVQYLAKGTKVMVIGELSETEYNDKKYLNLNVNQIEMLGEKQNQGQQFQQQGQQFQQQGQQFQPQQQQQQQQQQQPAQQNQSDFDPFNAISGGVY